MSKFLTLKSFRSDDKGVTAIEYGLIAAGVGVAIITAVGFLGGNLSEMFNNVANAI